MSEKKTIFTHFRSLTESLEGIARFCGFLLENFSAGLDSPPSSTEASSCANTTYSEDAMASIESVASLFGSQPEPDRAETYFRGLFKKSRVQSDDDDDGYSDSTIGSDQKKSKEIIDLIQVNEEKDLFQAKKETQNICSESLENADGDRWRLNCDDILTLEEKEHREFDKKRMVRSESMQITSDRLGYVWPPAVCAVREVSSRGSVTGQARYKKVSRCVGVLVCKTCPYVGRPPTSRAGVSDEIDIDRDVEEEDDQDWKKNIEKWRVCPRCSDPEERIVILEHFRCPGEFEITRPKASTNMRIYIVNACNEHPYPVKIRQTLREKNRMKVAVTNGEKLSIQARDIASQSNNGLYQQRVSDLKKALELKSPETLIKTLEGLGTYQSSKEQKSLLIVAEYEGSVIENGSTIHIDSTYKVVKKKDEMGNDYRSGMQLISMSCFSKLLGKQVILRGMFSKPTTQKMYEIFFEGFFEAHGLPSESSYFGISSDFSTSQILAWIVAFVNFQRKTKKLRPLESELIVRDQTMVMKVLEMTWRGCQFHYRKAIVELKAIISDVRYERVKEILIEMETAIDGTYYKLDEELVKISSESGMKDFRNWLVWWRDQLFGMRFRSIHWQWLRTSRRQYLAKTNNAQEAMHKVIKYDFGVKGTNLMVAAKRLTSMLEQTNKEMRDAKAGYKTKWGKQKGVPKYPKKNKKRQEPQPILQVDSNYDLTYGVTKTKKQRESSNKKQRVLNITSDVEIPNSYKVAVNPKSSSKGYPIACFSWSRNSCPLDSVLAALLLAYCWIEGKWGIQTPVDRCDVATINFFEFFLRTLEEDATPKSTTARALRDEKDLLVKIHSGKEKTDDMWGSVLEWMPKVSRALAGENVRFYYTMEEVSRAGAKKSNAKSTIYADILFWLKTRRETRRLPNLISFLVGSAENILQDRQVPYKIHHEFEEAIHEYTLTSIIFYNGVHFNTILLVSNQNANHHFVKVSFPGSNHTTFIQNGIWKNDPKADLDAERAPCFRNILHNTQLSINLKSESPKNMMINAATGGPHHFGPNCDFKPHIWIYCKTNIMPATHFTSYARLQKDIEITEQALKNETERSTIQINLI